MKKENTILAKIINLARCIFSEVEFNKFLSLVKLRLLNQMRLCVEEKLEFLETRLILYKGNAIIEAQLQKCKELDTAVTNLCIEAVEIKT